MKVVVGRTYGTPSGDSVHITQFLNDWGRSMYVKRKGDGCAWREDGTCIAYAGRGDNPLSNYTLLEPVEDLGELI